MMVLVGDGMLAPGRIEVATFEPECGIKSLAEFVAAKAKAKAEELDRAIMARATHLRVERHKAFGYKEPTEDQKARNFQDLMLGMGKP